MADTERNFLMHIPPYHKLATWQRFFAGMLFGGIVASLFLLYMYSSLYEYLIIENIEMKETITDLTSQNKALLEDQSESSTPLTVREIEIIISNQEVFRDDSLLDSQLKSLIKQEINHLIGIEIPVLSESEELLI